MVTLFNTKQGGRDTLDREQKIEKRGTSKNRELTKRTARHLGGNIKEEEIRENEEKGSKQEKHKLKRGRLGLNRCSVGPNKQTGKKVLKLLCEKSRKNSSSKGGKGVFSERRPQILFSCRKNGQVFLVVDQALLLNWQVPRKGWG